MKLGMIFLIIGIVLVLFLANVKFEKKVLKQIGIIIGVLLVLYGVILSIQPKEYIKYTKTTISKDTDSSKTK